MQIPVWVDESVQFIDVKTLVLKVHGVQEPCNDFLPLTIQAVESWVEINHGVICKSSTYGETPRRRDLQAIFKSDIKALGKQLSIFDMHLDLDWSWASAYMLVVCKEAKKSLSMEENHIP